MKALVIDDELVSRLALDDLVRSFEHLQVVPCEDGEDAWRLMQSGVTPVLCCCDVKMPKVSGIDLLRLMKVLPHLADVPFLMVSSAADRDTVRNAIALGAQGYILKPLHFADARARLAAVLEREWSTKIAEDPAQTCHRLKISADKLERYFAAFAVQIERASTDLQRLISAGTHVEAAERLKALHTGSLTLGLWHASGTIKHGAEKVGGCNVQELVDLVSSTLAHQVQRLAQTRVTA